MLPGIIVRNQAIDLLRAIGIGGMIANHIGTGEMSRLISAFHMPLFFFVSGLFFTGDKPFGGFAAQKAKKILIPYLSFAVFYYIVWLFINRTDMIWYGPLKYLLWDNSVGAGNPGMPYVGALWFLTAFFVANIVYFGISSIRSRCLQFALVLGVVSLGMLFPLILPFRLPFTLDSGLVGVGFMCCGHRLKNSAYYEKLSHLSYPVLLIMSAVLLILIFMNGPIGMRAGVYSNVILFWVNALGCIIVGINVCNKVIAGKRGNSILLRIIAVMGRDSLVFLCVNEAVIIVLRHIITGLNKWITYLSCFFITILICYVINYCIQYTKLKVFIGKF